MSWTSPPDRLWNPAERSSLPSITPSSIIRYSAPFTHRYFCGPFDIAGTRRVDTSTVLIFVAAGETSAAVFFGPESSHNFILPLRHGLPSEEAEAEAAAAALQRAEVALRWSYGIEVIVIATDSVFVLRKMVEEQDEDRDRHDVAAVAVGKMDSAFGRLAMNRDVKFWLLEEHDNSEARRFLEEHEKAEKEKKQERAEMMKKKNPEEEEEKKKNPEEEEEKKRQVEHESAEVEKVKKCALAQAGDDDDDDESWIVVPVEGEEEEEEGAENVSSDTVWVNA